MSVRLLQNLGILFLVIILLVVSLIAYRHSRHTADYLSTIIGIQESAQHDLIAIQYALENADHKLDMFFHQLRVKQDEVLEPLDRLVSLLRRLGELKVRGSERFDNEAGVLQRLIQDFLDANVPESDSTRQKEVQEQIQTSLGRIRRLLTGLNRELSNAQDEEAVRKVTKVVKNLLISAEIRLIRYSEQKTVRVVDIVASLNTAEQVLIRLRDTLELDRKDHAHERNTFTQHHGLLKKLLRTIQRLQASINFYAQEEGKMDPSADQLINLRKLVSDLRDKVETLYFEVNHLINIHIQEDQQTFQAKTSRSQSMFLLFAIAGLLLAIFVGIQLSRVVGRSVYRLVDGVSRFSNGDLEHRINFERQDEFGQIADAFNQMAINLKQKEAALRHSLSLLDTANREITEANQVLEIKVSERTAELQRTMQLAQQASQAKSEFLANMSHELRTPMHAILSFASLGEKKIAMAPQEKLKTYFVNISESGRRLLSLLNDLLDLSKLEAGQMQLEFGEHDLQTVVEKTVTELGELVKKKSLTLDVLPADVCTVAEFDSDKLLQVVRNLLSNAIKFTPEGKHIKVSFGDARLAAGQRRTDTETVPAIKLNVSDQGVGIPLDEMECIFDKFVQSSKTRSGAGGTGLGLAICKEIIEAHGGSIQAANQVQGGATFTCAIPRRTLRG